MYKSIQIFFSALLLVHTFSYPLSIAITIDDYPLPHGKLFTLEKRTQKFIEAGKIFNCSIAFFCVGSYHLERGQDELIYQLMEAGHFIANHSLTHPASSTLTPEQFKEEIVATERILSFYYHYKYWFRYPGLDYGHLEARGGSAKKKKMFENILEELNYKDGYVTIDSYDWYINKKLSNALKEEKSIDYTKLRDFYVGLIEDRIKFYEKAYEETFSEPIIHTLLLHDNDLTALYLKDILAMIQKNGWLLVSPEYSFAETEWHKDMSVFYAKKFAWISFIEVGQHFDDADIIQ